MIFYIKSLVGVCVNGFNSFNFFRIKIDGIDIKMGLIKKKKRYKDGLCFVIRFFLMVLIF